MEEERARRRRLTSRKIKRRQGFPWWAEQSDHPAHRWAKVSPGGCDCRKRTHGKPREPAGMCCCRDRERVYFWRRERLEQKAWWTAGEEVP